MNNSNQYDELLIKYLADDLNTGERNFVESWIKESEQNRKYFEELRHVWNLAAVKQTLDQVLDGMNMEDKWNRFQNDVAANKARILPVSGEEELESENIGEEEAVRKPVVYRLFIAAAIAASVLLVIGLGWKFFVGNKQETPVAVNPGLTVDSALSFVHHEVNTSGKEKRIQLPDGSLIILADKSEITYKEPFTNKRDITLKGKAKFNVAKDQSRPFTVISGEISTTALGTEFTVTAFENTNRIIVRLYEGKVVVKAVDKANKKMRRDVYLLPGQELVYGSTVIVRSFKLDNSAVSKEKGQFLDNNPSIPQGREEGTWYMFNNQSLGQVLDQLAKMYQVKIIYDKKVVQNIYFTRQYNSLDSIENILKEIATLNDLTITKDNDTFYIKK